MADPRYRVMVVRERIGAMPEDDVVNVLHFEGDDDVAKTDRENWDDMADGLFDRIAVWLDAWDQWCSAALSGNVTIKAYDLSDPEPRPVRYERAHTTTQNGGAVLPAECAACVTLYAEVNAGENPARRRGRVYLGPLAAATGELVAESPDFRIKQTVINDILNATETMAHGGGMQPRLAVFSPTIYNIDQSYTDAFSDVIRLGMDNAYDIQRRRGADASSRSFVDVTG